MRKRREAAPQPTLPLGDPVPDPGVVSRPRPRNLDGPSLSLRPVEPEADLDDLFAAASGDPDRDAIWTYMHVGPFPDREAMLAWLRECAAATDCVTLTVVDSATERRLGMATFMRIREAMRTLELGSIWYGLDTQRTHVNTETIYLMLCEAFDHLACRRVEWKCDALNERSRKAALRLGFEFEAIFRQHMVIKGRSRDTAWFAMLDEDWPAIKARLESLLGL